MDKNCRKIKKAKADMKKAKDNIKEANRGKISKGEIARYTIKISEELEKEIEKMKNSLEKELVETVFQERPLIAITQSGYKKNAKQLNTSEMINIMISIELKKLRHTWKYLNKIKPYGMKMNISFLLPEYDMLCSLLESHRLNQNKKRYFALCTLFGRE